MGEPRISIEKKQRSGEPQINEQIKAREVRLIDAKGEQLGVQSIDEALRLSLEAGLDLVEISPDSSPPVCRIMDYGKFKFQQSKKKAAAKKKQKQSQLKEIKIRPATEEADYQVKVRSVVKFLENGDKVKITVRFRGREMSHSELGMKLMEKMMAELQNCSTVEQMPKFEGRQIVMVLGPKKK